MFEDAQPVAARAEPSGCEVLKPSRTVTDVKPSSSSGGVADRQVVDVSAPAELLCAPTSPTDDVNRAESPHSLTGDLTGYYAVFLIEQRVHTA